ncbi:MAG: hypothetical protein ACI85O_001603 [Saprospiraceae bacterium]|jgi:hypothetical protein
MAFLFSLTAHSQEIPILTAADTSFSDVYRIMDDFYSSQEDDVEGGSEEEEEGGTENEFYRWANFWKPRLANSENIFRNRDMASALMLEAIYDYDVCEISATNSTVRGDIEQGIALAVAEKQEAVNWFVRYYAERDSIYPVDSVRYWLNNGGTFTQRMQIANTYVEEENYGQAGVEIQAILSDFTLDAKQERELNQSMDLLHLWKNEGSLNYFDLNGFVSSYQSDLIGLTENKKLLFGQRAAALLYHARGEETYEPEAIFPTLPSTFNFQQPLDNEESQIGFGKQISINIAPNPVSDKTVISYNILENTVCEVIQITDFTGKVLVEQKIDAKQGNITFNSSNYPRGVLVCRILCDGEVIYSKIIISVK